MAGKPPYFPFYVRDFVSDGKVEAMTTEEVGAYILLLCKAWLEEPPGSLPNDDAILARWARLDAAAWSACRARVLSPFTISPTDKRYHQKRMQAEFRKFMTLSKARSNAGRKGAQNRWQGGDTHDTPDGKAIALPSISHCQKMATGSGSVSGSSSSGDGVAGEGAKNGVPPPSGFRTALPCDNPELAAIARRIVRHYQDCVKPAHTEKLGVPAVIEQLHRGRTEEQLRNAALAYAAWCRSEGKQPKYRESVRSFYADGTCEQYLDYKPSDPVAEARKRAEQQLIDRQKEQAEREQLDADPKRAQKVKEMIRKVGGSSA